MPLTYGSCRPASRSCSTSSTASGDPAVSTRADELVRAVVGLYGGGLSRIVELLDEAQVRELAGDPLVAQLLLLHDLHPDDLRTRVQQALDHVRPYLGSHAGGIDYLGLDDAGVAHLRLEGSCDGCPSSSVTVKLAIEQAVLDAAPEIDRVEVEGMVEPTPKPRQLLQIQRRPGMAEPTEDGWQHISVGVEPGRMQRYGGGLDLVVCHVGDGYYAYRNACADCGAELSAGELIGTELQCGQCGHRYDVPRAGRQVGGGNALDAFPLLRDGDEWRVATPVAAP